MDHVQSTRALQIASLVTGGVGLLMVSALFAGPGAALLDRFVDMARLPFDGAQAGDTDAARLFTAIAGGVLVGWATTTWLLVRRVYAHDPAIGTAVILPGFVVWYLIDGVGSWLAGAPFNIVLNTPFLLLFAVPILLDRARSWPARA